MYRRKRFVIFVNISIWFCITMVVAVSRNITVQGDDSSPNLEMLVTFFFLIAISMQQQFCNTLNFVQRKTCLEQQRRVLAMMVFSSQLSRVRVVSGGTSLLPGFRHRLLFELKELVATEKRYSKVSD